LPLLNVSDYFHEKKTETKRENIVVVQYAGRRFGFIVDELYGEFQTVIKPLGRVFSNLRGISGATILGSGNVALILDIPVLGSHVANLASNQSKSGGGNEP
jgi:two-component system chemotaxis sensor kinase CheA